MDLDHKQTDRALGVLLASAAGDALGVPYEFKPPITHEPEQIGGGAGPYAPAEWSDDTQMACVIARVAATGADLRTPESLDTIADGLLAWYADGASDVGIQTRKVLGASTPGAGSAARMTAVAAAQPGKTGGNGSLMRTGPVALAHLGDTDGIVTAARAVSALTHSDPDAGDACVLWCLAIDHTIRTGGLDMRVGLSHVADIWATRLHEAEAHVPSHFEQNGWVVGALQAAWSAISRTDNLHDALVAAVQAGRDTDTVAAIAGSLAGARYGSSAVPFAWRRRLHGWPQLRARDLNRLGYLVVHGGHDDREGWPSGPSLASYDGASSEVVEHPDDPGVLLGAVGALRPGVADAVVSLCRLGRDQVPLSGVSPDDHLEVRLLDLEDANLDVAGVLRDTAEAVATYRAEGKTVFLHCVHAHTRTPLAAAAYGARITGGSTKVALERVLSALPSGRPRRSLRAIAEATDFSSS